MKRLMLVWVMTAVVLLFSLGSIYDNGASAESSYFGQQSGDYWYRLDSDGNATITRYEGNRYEENTTELVIPAELDGHPVTRIGGAAFHGHYELDYVSLQEGITEIEAQAFGFCGRLTGVTLPDSLTVIGDYAFSHSGLTDIAIPQHVTSIGESAFGCTGLTSVTIPKSVVTVKGNPFSSCTELAVIEVAQDSVSLMVIDGVLFSTEDDRLICYPSASERTEYIVPEHTRLISDFAFSYVDKLTTLIIPEGVTGIGRLSFNECPSLAYLLLPASLTKIGSDMLNQCPSAVVITPFISDAHTYCHDHNLRCVAVRDLATEQMRLDHSPSDTIDIRSAVPAFETDLDAVRIGIAIIDELHEQSRFPDLDLRMVEHIRENGVWVYSYWADSMALGYTLNIAVDGHDGHIVSVWTDD